MIVKFRLWLARKILGQHCACYRMGYHDMCDYKQRAQDALQVHQARKP